MAGFVGGMALSAVSPEIRQLGENEYASFDKNLIDLDLPAPWQDVDLTDPLGILDPKDLADTSNFFSSISLRPQDWRKR